MAISNRKKGWTDLVWGFTEREGGRKKSFSGGAAAPKRFSRRLRPLLGLLRAILGWIQRLDDTEFRNHWARAYIRSQR
nr:hypothetical protein CFP56_26393 [Quercus suber]